MSILSGHTLDTNASTMVIFRLIIGYMPYIRHIFDNIGINALILKHWVTMDTPQITNRHMHHTVPSGHQPIAFIYNCSTVWEPISHYQTRGFYGRQ